MPVIKEEKRPFIKVTRENAISERFLESAEVNQYGLKLTFGDKSGAAVTEQLFAPKADDVKIKNTPLGKEYTKLKDEIKANKDWKGIGEKFKTLREVPKFKDVFKAVDNIDDTEKRNLEIIGDLLSCYYDKHNVGDEDWMKFFKLVADLLQDKQNIGIRIKLVYKSSVDKETGETKYFASLPRYGKCIEKMSIIESKSKLKIEAKDIVDRPGDNVTPNDDVEPLVPQGDLPF